MAGDSGSESILRRVRGRIVFTSGGEWRTRLVAALFCLIGAGTIAAAFAGSGDFADSRLPGYIIGAAMIVVGLAVASYRAGTRFDVALRRWDVTWSILGITRKRAGRFDDLKAVELSRSEISTEGGQGSGPYAYHVRVKIGEAMPISVVEATTSIHEASQTAAELSEALGLPLEDITADYPFPKSILVPAPGGLPMPPSTLSSYTIRGSSVTFLLPPGTRIEAVGCMAVLLAIACSAVGALRHWVFRPEGENPVGNAMLVLLLGLLFVLPPALGAAVIFVKAFLMSVTLTVEPDAVTYCSTLGPWISERRIPRSEITGLELCVEKGSNRVREIQVSTPAEPLSFGRGLPDEEKAWLASVTRQILGLAEPQQDGDV